MRCEKWPLPVTFGCCRQMTLKSSQADGAPAAALVKIERAITQRRAAGAVSARLDEAQIDALVAGEIGMGHDIAEPALPRDLDAGTP